MTYRIFALFILQAMIMAGSLQANEPAFEARIFKPEASSSKLLYRILLPKTGVAAKQPLLLCLHGAGERGSDNEKHLGWFSPLFSRENLEKHPCVIVAPQVPSGMLWATYGWSTTSEKMAEAPSETMLLTKQLVDQLIESGMVDANRVYVTGLSMGGYGTWEFAQRWPDSVAAIAPVCGGGDISQAKRLAAVPVWAFHGENDGVVKVSESTKMIDAMKAEGMRPKLSVYPKVGHDSWRQAYADPELLTWLFSQRRSKTFEK